MTEKVYEELDKAKAEIEKLRSEYHVKSNLCNSLKRSHDDQIKRIQELNLKLEQQSQEVEAKTDEIHAANQSLKELQSKLKDKENIIKSFTSTNDKLRIDFNSKLQETEEEKINLLSSLDEANMKISDLEQKNRDFMDKIEVLKEGIVSVSQKKCASESKVAKASKQMRERGDMFEKLEEEKVKLEEQIKWKNEQFKHLEEAHEKLRDKLRTKEKEWDMEKSSFFDEISTLETKLDSQITLSEDLKRRLEASNQDLAHEKNQRKIQIQEANNSSSIAKLQKKLKTLEQIHSKCSGQIEVKEAEWRSQMEKVVSDLNSCRKEIEKKDSHLKKITKELDGYNSLMLKSTMEKEESEVMIVTLKSTLLEAKLKIHDLVKFQESMKEQDAEMESLKKEMKKVCDLLDMANEEVAEKCCEVNEVEFELQIWKSIAENLKVNLEVNHQMRREVEASLLSQVAIEVNLKEENEEKGKRINDLEQQLEELKKKMEMHTLLRFSKEKQSLDKIVEEKDERIKNLQKIMESLEEEFNDSSVCFSSQLSKMQSEVNLFHEAWEKIRTSVVMKEIEVELRDLMIVEMEKDLEKIFLEKEKLMEIIGGVSERINKLSREDGQMMGTLRSIVMSFDDEKDRFDPVKENTNVFQSPKRRTMVESGHDLRSPLRALNN
ncbi:unnamed protein product [Lactuca virosa]|uniref:Uncharacterized protein n=1 Tax=Lactuca virosa TaxID=75947 RepID=A0AAU9NGW4_9ASTR|nr:unnamed protein product [Lactuca virosa]